MNLSTHMMCNKPHNPLAIVRRQPLSGIDEAAGEPIDPEPAIGVEHHLDDRSVFEPKRDGRSERGAQHAGAARRRLLIEMMDCHFGPQAWRLRIAAEMSGIIRKVRMCARATGSDQA
jgi:hypothetical protein